MMIKNLVNCLLLLVLTVLYVDVHASGGGDKSSESKATGFEKIDPDKITIVRDKWGVPHIFAKTDAEVAYGLAWANAEDDFPTMQELILAGKGMAGRALGKNGAKRDFLAHLVNIEELVESKYETEISEDFKRYLDGYCQGLNAYAAENPEELLVKKAFPVTPKDILKGYIFATTVISGVHTEVGKIMSGTYDERGRTWMGSNAMAFSPIKTEDESTILVVNPHQPVEGPFSWYEAHLCSEEGMNILGALFPGGTAVFLGTNENLGWAHTVNKVDIVDVYKLEMHPEHKFLYKYDGKWVQLEERPVSLKVKVAGLVSLPFKKKTYWSKYGATLKSKEGEYYAIKYPGNEDIRAPEQMYRMNKASNFSEFHQALEMQAYPRYNVVYADKSDTIFYINNGKLPVRDPNYDWAGVLPGNTSRTLWTDIHPLEDLPQVLNPECGYIFNTNNTPFNATCGSENLNRTDYPEYMGFDPGDNNRSERFMELLQKFDQVSLDDVKAIKFDNQLPDSSVFLASLSKFTNINPSDYPEIQSSLEKMQQWDKHADKENKDASLFLLTYQYLFEKLDLGVGAFMEGIDVAEEMYVEAVTYAQGHLMKHFNTTDIQLGELQMLVRGKTAYPVGGFPDVLAPVYNVPYKKGRLKPFVGDSYVQFARFKDGKVELETLHPFGASNRKDSPHFTDQMELYVNHQTKKMTLEKAAIFENAESIYHPR